MIKKVSSLVFLILLFNSIFYLQSLLKSELQFYLLGFRLNLFMVINFLLIYFNREKLSLIIPFLKYPGKVRDYFTTFLFPVMSVGITLLIINQIGVLKYKKPDFLIEFGLTSLIDIPIYYFWNLPFLISSIALIILLIERFSFLRVTIFSILTSMAFIFSDGERFLNKFVLVELYFWLLIFALIFYNMSVLKIYKSIWISVFSIIISIYSYVLVFGSKNSFVIRTFFARTYSEWDGIFTIKKINSEIIDLVFAGSIILFALFFFIFDREKSS